MIRAGVNSLRGGDQRWSSLPQQQSVALLSRAADKMARHKAHSGHIVLTRMPALVTGTSRLATSSPGKRITALVVSALRCGTRTQPCSTAQEHQHHSDR